MNDQQIIESMENPTVFDVIIVGGGVAGLTAGLYSARDGFKTLVLEGYPVSSTDMPGGALMLTSEIANYPGFNAAAGMDLIQQMRDQAEQAGAIIVSDRAQEIIPSKEKGKCHGIRTEEEQKNYRARVVIIATGAVAKSLGIPGESEMWGRGVSTCATCDGFFFVDKTVAVVGGGDTAVEDALLLTKFATQVHLFVRGDKLKASGPEAREIVDHPYVTIHWNSHLTEIHNQDNKISHISYVQSGEPSQLEVDGVFVAIGSVPATDWLKETPVVLDEEGYVLVESNSTVVQGDVTGIYAAGDVADKVFRQAVTSAGKAAQAVIEARGYLNTYHC